MAGCGSVALLTEKNRHPRTHNKTNIIAFFFISAIPPYLWVI